MTTRHRQAAPTVHIHIAALDAPARDVDACRRMIDEDERRRADRFRDSIVAARWIVGRARMREVLADHLDADPGDIAFRDGYNGKPMLARMRRALFFNLSHSEGLELIAVCGGDEVGVDVEYERALPSWPSVAARVFTPDELELIRAEPPERQLHHFYRAWTRKEAVIKATGEGLSADLKRITVSTGDDAKLLAWPGSGAADWHLHHIEPAHNYVGALAIQSSLAPTIVVHRDAAGGTTEHYGGRAVA